MDWPNKPMTWYKSLLKPTQPIKIRNIDLTVIGHTSQDNMGLSAKFGHLKKDPSMDDYQSFSGQEDLTL